MEKDTDSNSELNKYGVWIKTPPRTAKEGDVEMLAPAEGEPEVAEQDYSMPDFKFLNDQAELAAAADEMDAEDQPLKDIELPPDIVIPSQDTDTDLSSFDDELDDPIATEVSATELSEILDKETFPDEPLPSEPLVEEPEVSEPVANESPADETLTDEPLVDETELSEILDNETFSDEPLTSEPVADETEVSEPLTSEPFVNEPEVSESLDSENSADKPLASEPLVEERASSSGTEESEADDLNFETVPTEDISVEEEGSNILDDGVTTEIDVNSFMDESAPVKREASEDEEVSIDDFLDSSDSTPDGDVSINEFISSNSTNPIGEQDNFVPDGEISLDAFLDSPLEASKPEQKQEEEVYDDPIDIDLSFDDTLKVETEENSELDDILDDFTSQDSSSSSSASAGESVDMDSFFSDSSQDESSAAPKKTVSMEDTTEAISADDFDSMFGPSDSGESQSVDLSDFGISEDQAKPQAKEVPQKKPDFDLKVSSDGSLEENSAEGIGQETEDDNISIFMDDTSKNQVRKEAPVKTETTAQDDDFDLDSLLDSIEDESGKTVSIGNEDSPAPTDDAPAKVSASDTTVADDATVTESDFSEADATAVADDATVTESDFSEADAQAVADDATVAESDFSEADATAVAEDVTVTERDFSEAEAQAVDDVPLTESNFSEADATAVEGESGTDDTFVEDGTTVAEDEATEGGDETFPQAEVVDQSDFAPEEDNALGQEFREEDQTFPQAEASEQTDESVAEASAEEDATIEDTAAEEATLAQEDSAESFSEEPDVFEGTEFLPEEDNAVSLNFQEAGQERSLPQESEATSAEKDGREEFNPFSEETVETVFEEADLEDPSLPRPVSEDTISYSTEETKSPQYGENISIASFLGSEDFEDPIDSMVQKELKVQAEEEEEKMKKDIDESANSVENSTIDNEGVEPETTGEGNMDNAIDNNELLTQIVDDLKEVKNEISNLKSEFEEFKRNGAGSESEEVIEPVVEPIPNDGDKGFFGDEDDDDTIALSGDELTNILSSAEMTSENSDGEQELEAPSSSADARESVQTEEDILGSAESMPDVPNDYNQEDADSDVDFGNESLEEPNLDEVEINSSEEESDDSEESDSEEEIEVPKVDDILVESSNSDFIENGITGDVPAPAEESEGEFTESQDFEEPLVGEEELKAEAEEQSERLAAELSEADDDNSEDEDSSDTTPEMDQILATIHQENMEKDKIHPEVYSESEESEESPLEEPVAPQVNEPEKELDIEALKNEALEEFDEPEVVENEDIENESSVEVEYVPATGGDPFANEEKPELTEDNIEFLKEDEDEKIEPGISEEPVTKVFNGWENPDNTDDAVSEEEAAQESVEAEEEPTLEASETEVAEPEVADEVPGASGLSAVAQASSGESSDSAEDAPSEAIPEELKEEIKTVLSYMDQLLENLPEEKIEEFARSEQFSTYKKLFKELGLS
ncbi:MAG: hypothetical protein J5817_11635 [Treponema sp.]|nr:hypothetical protein [Treponema sp.]